MNRIQDFEPGIKVTWRTVNQSPSYGVVEKVIISGEPHLHIKCNDGKLVRISPKYVNKL
jgi:hypothetical protein